MSDIMTLPGSALSEEVQNEERRLQLGSVPTKTEIANIEFDITLDCNLRCRYCYKGEKRAVYMPRRVAFDAVIWLIYASGNQKSISVFFMGGEPLMNFSLIKELVPFGITRAKQHGKKLHFGMTTNGTMVTDEVIDFFKKWDLSFHTSFDGIPEVQNKNRPTATGGPSSHLVESAARKILAYRPNTAARCSFDAENARYLFDNYTYFRSLGYKNIVIIPAYNATWTEDVLGLLEEQYMRIAERWMDEYRTGESIYFKQFEDYFTNRKRKNRGTISCGAGRAYGTIDAEGNYWPCSRWAIHERATWSFANIYDSFREDAREELMKGFPPSSFFPECANCEARCICNGGCMAENFDTVGEPLRIIPISCKVLNIWVRVGKHIHDTLYREKNPAFMKKCYPEMSSGGSQGTAAPRECSPK